MVALRDLDYGPRLQRTTKPGIQGKNLQEIAQYCADMTLELRNLAKSANLKTLQGLLEITYYEAFSAANPVVLPEGEAERLAELEKAAVMAEAGRH